MDTAMLGDRDAGRGSSSTARGVSCLESTRSTNASMALELRDRQSGERGSQGLHRLGPRGWANYRLGRPSGPNLGSRLFRSGRVNSAGPGSNPGVTLSWLWLVYAGVHPLQFPEQSGWSSEKTAAPLEQAAGASRWQVQSPPSGTLQALRRPGCYS
jgi:hypothetical protein